MPYDPNHQCDRCNTYPHELNHLPVEERIFYVRFPVYAQWNGEEYHLCNECIGWYMDNEERNVSHRIAILDGASDDEEEDPSSSEEDETNADAEDPK